MEIEPREQRYKKGILQVDHNGVREHFPLKCSLLNQSSSGGTFKSKCFQKLPLQFRKNGLYQLKSRIIHHFQRVFSLS